MANQFKGMWVALFLCIAGAIIVFLTITSNKPHSSEIALTEIFNQEVKTDPVVAPAIVAETDFGKQNGFSVQVYSFQDKNRAHVALSTLKNNGYSAYIIMSDLGDKGIWYRVRIGDIKDEKTAHVILEKVRKDYNSGIIIKPTSPLKK